MSAPSVHVTVEDLGPCKKLLRVEVDTEGVAAAFASAAQEFQRQARLPGFRPGKAPREMIERTYGPAIEAQVKRTLVPKAYQEALQQSQLRPVSLPDIEEVQFGRSLPLQFTATIETEPSFELPEYRGLRIRRELRSVGDQDVDQALAALRTQRPNYVDVTRPVQAGDFVVVHYTGTCEGRPIAELAPTARGVGEQKNTWLHVSPDYLIPGFTDQLVGANAGDKRTVTVTFPADFVNAELAGKIGVYEVEVLQVKERHLPAVDDAMARAFGAPDLAQLRTGVRKDLENEVRYRQKRDTRNQLVAVLLGRVSCELPEAMVQAETKNAVMDIVKTNTERGISKSAIDERKDEIYSVASNNARERVKARIILGRIADKEGIRATEAELTQQVVQLAARYQIKPDRLVKQLQERGALAEIQEQIVSAKVLDFLESQAQIEDVPVHR
ncbi:MAG: trigger factor [Verrucomicrobia bacterium]|nr:trigger factor [Verrucomicrobiota bacterium]